MTRAGVISPLRFEVTHRTEYRYDAEVASSYGIATLLPRITARQQVESASLTLDPPPAYRNDRLDSFGNCVTQFEILEPHRSLSVVARSVVVVNEAHPDVPASPPWEHASIHGGRPLDDPEAVAFALASALVDLAEDLTAYARVSFPPGRPLAEGFVDLCHRIHAEFEYSPGATTVTTPPETVMATRRGVCQDFSHLAIGCLRALGLPARYVSGYLETDPPPGLPHLAGADGSHSWCGVRIPGHGWFDVDPTNATVVGPRHITTAWGRDYNDVTPLKGVVFTDGASHDLDVAVDVVRIVG
jgi:transglutaminase-like putative cysteine protease